MSMSVRSASKPPLDGRKRVAVKAGDGAIGLNRGTVLYGTVSSMEFKTIATVHMTGAGHHPVPCHLGKDEAAAIDTER